MNSTFLRVLAILMGIAALATAALGYRMSHKAPAETIKVTIPTYPQVIAHQYIPVGHVLTLEDMEVVSTPQQDPQTFSDPQPLIGKTTLLPVEKGTSFKHSDFPVISALAQSLAANERAVAIKVTEVVGVGGFIKPGDHVDVLLYIRKDHETNEISSAQVILNNVKVLAYGSLTSQPEPTKPEQETNDTPNKLGTVSNRSGLDTSKDSRSAILAVDTRDIAKLMLADSTGVLRLALRGEAPPDAPMTPHDPQFIRLGDIAQTPGTAAKSALKTSAAPTQIPLRKAAAVPANKQEQVIMHRGEKVEIVKVTK